MYLFIKYSFFIKIEYYVHNTSIFINFINLLNNVNIYKAMISDRIHHLNLGLFHYQIKCIKKF